MITIKQLNELHNAMFNLERALMDIDYDSNSINYINQLIKDGNEATNKFSTIVHLLADQLNVKWNSDTERYESIKE